MKTTLTFEEFYKRIAYGHNNDDSKWRDEVGYRPADKDSGFRRWLELTGNKMDECLDEFSRVVYGDHLQQKEIKKDVEQLDLFST